MSSYRVLSSSLVDNTIGSSLINLEAGPSKYIEANNTILTQTSYPRLFQQFGLIKDNIGYDVWITGAAGSAQNIQCVTKSNTIYFYVAGAGVIRTSTTGLTWTARTSGTSSALRGAVFANNKYYYCGDGGVMGTSTNGTTWTLLTSNTVSNLYAMGYDGSNTIIAVGVGGSIVSSTDGNNWIQRSLGATTQLRSVVWDGSKFLIAAGLSLIYTTTDCITFNTISLANVTTPSIGIILGLGYNGNTFIAVGQFAVCRSTDANTWVGVKTLTQTGQSVTYGNGHWHYCDFAGDIYSSTDDGVTWDQENVNAGGLLSSIYHDTSGNNDIILAFGGVGRFRYAMEYTYNKFTQFLVPKYQVTEQFGTLGKFFIKGD